MLRRCVFLTAVCCLAFLAACGGDTGSPAPPGPRAFAGPLTVSAASSLKKAFGELQGTLAKESPQLALTLNFAGSQSLARQVESGAAVDVFAAADERTMQGLEEKELVDRPAEFARNRLEIAVAPRNPKGIRTLADLGRAGLVVVLADPSVPLGNYGVEAFRKAGVPVPAAKSLELDARAALAKVAAGEADAAVVYATDIRSSGDVEGVVIPDEANVVVRYVIARVTASEHPDTANAFVQAVLSRQGQDILRANGFLPPG